MSIKIAVAGALAAVLIGGAGEAATFVSATNSGTTDLGVFAAGNYTITATGIAFLTPEGDFQIGPDGVPVTAVTHAGYGYFNPSGSAIADGHFGAGGAGIKIGGLMGSFIAVAPLGDDPAPLATYFALGYSTNIVHTGGHIYAQVNETVYSNDHGGFDVTVAPTTAAVPEPATWAMMVIGFGSMGAMLRRRRALPA